LTLRASNLSSQEIRHLSQTESDYPPMCQRAEEDILGA
jgi:hypothetical protein